MGNKNLGEEPEGEVHSIVLHLLILPVDGHVEQVGHEGDLGDGGPQSPGQEVIDRATIALHTGKHYPGETDAPGSLDADGVCLKQMISYYSISLSKLHTLDPF